MEGNFRILQAAENEFIIQKEKFETITVGKFPWRSKVESQVWITVNLKGNPFNRLFDNKDDYVFKSIGIATAILSSIKKYPVVVYQDK